MSDVVKKKTIGKYLIKIIIDQDPINPRTEYDNVTTMVCFHSRHNLGDIENTQWSNNKDGMYEFKQWFKEHKEELISLPLRLYDHSGLTISTSGSYPYNDRWDSSEIGVIYIEKKKFLEEFDNQFKEWNKEAEKRAIEVLKIDVKTYDDYLRGECYGYEIIDTETQEEVDSCWGFLGDKEYCMTEAEGIVKYLMKEDQEWEEKAVTTVGYVKLKVEVKHSPEMKPNKIFENTEYSVEINNKNVKVKSVSAVGQEIQSDR